MDRELRILILEDVPTDAELIEHELRKAGFSFSSRRVETREGFIRELEGFAPDLILADYKLPDFDGLSALEIKKKKLPDVPFIFVTGVMGEEWAVETIKKGATDYVLKGRLFRLAPVVKHALNEAHLRTERKKAEQDLARLVGIIEATTDFVGFADAVDTRISYINPAGRRMVGIGADEDVTKLKIADVHPSWTNKLLAEVAMPVAVQGGVWSGECAFLSRDGREIPVLMVLLSHKDATGRVNIFSTISRDITERKNAEKKLKDRLDELERFSKVTVKRELKMGEIKAENESLKRRIEVLENMLKKR